MLRRLFPLVFVLGSIAGMASCGSTDESSLNAPLSPSSTVPGASTPPPVEDGGFTDAGGPDGGLPPVRAGRVLLVQGGDVTFLAAPHRPRRCPPGAEGDDGGVSCGGGTQYSGTVVIRGAHISILHVPGDGDAGVGGGDDGGSPTGGADVGSAAGEDDGGPSTPPGGDAGVAPPLRNALVYAERATFVLSIQSDGDAGVTGLPPPDGGATLTVGSAQLLGGQLSAVFGPVLAEGGDAGAPGQGDDDGGVPFRHRVREVRDLRAVLIQGATFHLRGGGDAADGGLP